LSNQVIAPVLAAIGISSAVEENKDDNATFNFLQTMHNVMEEAKDVADEAVESDPD